MIERMRLDDLIDDLKQAHATYLGPHRTVSAFIAATKAVQDIEARIEDELPLFRADWSHLLARAR